MTIEEMSIRMSNKQTEIMRDAMRETKEIPCFEFNGVFFRGNRFRVAMEYAYNNPTGGDFYVWCRDNCSIIK